MPTPHTRLLATVDERFARLFRCTRTLHAWRLEEIASTRSVWEADHEHKRPSILGHAPGFPPQDASFGHEKEEEVRRFARDVAGWLADHAPASSPGPIFVFAAPRFLGVLREECPDAWRSRLRLTELELTHLNPDQLAAHPAVIDSLSIESLS